MSREPLWLCHAADRSRNESWTVGWLLSRWRELEGISHEEIAVELACTPEVLWWIYLCHAPSDNRFSDEIRRISQRFGLEPTRLATLLRRADAVVTLAAEHEGASGVDLLLAARDHKEAENSG